MLATVIFSNTVWTFWDVMLLFFVFGPLLMLWFFCMFDVFGRRDLAGWGKALWLLAIVFLPWIGTLSYLVFRPWAVDSDPYGYGTGVDGSRSTAADQSVTDRVPAS